MCKAPVGERHAWKGKRMPQAPTSWLTKAIQNRMIALVMAMVVIVPFIATPAGGSWSGPAALAFEGFSIMLLAVLLWRARLNFTRQEIVNFLKTGANTPALLFLGLIVISTIYCFLSPNAKYGAYSAQEALRQGS